MNIFLLTASIIRAFYFEHYLDRRMKKIDVDIPNVDSAKTVI